MSQTSFCRNTQSTPNFDSGVGRVYIYEGRDAQYIGHHIGIGRYMFIFNVIVIGPIRKFGQYIKADK